MKKLILCFLLMASVAFASPPTASTPWGGQFDPATLCDSIGVGINDRHIANGVLYVSGPTQATLDQAVAQWDQAAYEVVQGKRHAARELKEFDEYPDIIDGLKDQIDLLMDALESAGVVFVKPPLPQGAQDAINKRNEIKGRL